MIKEELDTLAELLAKATPGEWRKGNCDFYVDGSDGDDLVIGCVGQAGGFRSHEYSVVRGRKSAVLDNNRAIVAAVNFLRDNLPAIREQADEVERLRAREFGIIKPDPDPIADYAVKHGLDEAELRELLKGAG